MWESCLAWIFKPVLKACLSSTRVVTLPFEVYIVPGLSLVSSTRWGYICPFKDIRRNWLGPTALYITKGPTQKQAAACLDHATPSLVHIHYLTYLKGMILSISIKHI